MALNKKRFKRLLRTLLILLALLGLVYGLGWSKLISVKKISFTGTNQVLVLQNSLQAAHVDLQPGIPLARVDVRAINRIAQQLGWIKESEISRNWLTGLVSIHVIERMPVASYLGADGRTQYFDALGSSFSSPAQYLNLPTITFTQSTAQTRVAAATLVAALPDDLLGLMQNLWVNSPEKIVMKASVSSPQEKTITINWGGINDLPLKVKVLRALLLRPENAKHHLFDLSNPLAPITR